MCAGVGPSDSADKVDDPSGRRLPVDPVIGRVSLKYLSDDWLLDEKKSDYAAFTASLAKSKVTLAQAIAAAEKSGETVISAMYDMDEVGLRLFILTAVNGLAAEAKQNSFKEYAGDPTADTWEPKGVELTDADADELKEATEQLSVMAKAGKPLKAILLMASAEKAGTVFSIVPAMIEGHPMFQVLVAGKDDAVELHYDVETGEKIEPKK